MPIPTAELGAYLENGYDADGFRETVFPLEDESFVPVWEGYARRAEAEGAFEVLSRALVQLSFPVSEGISETEAYRAAARRGIRPEPEAREPAPGTGGGIGIDLSFASSPAGRLPVLLARKRDDFVFLIRALAYKNEPVLVPESMGSLIVMGYTNWDRIHAYREGWEREHPDQEWLEHFAEFTQDKTLYQDKFIILSDSPYSAVRAESLGLDEERWKDLSWRIRIGHEMGHYFCKRVLSCMKNNLLDELLADFVGIRHACGGYRSDWLLRFMGLEAEEGHRSGGRVENYTRTLSRESFSYVCRLLRRAAVNLDKLAIPEGEDESFKALVALSRFRLDELAAEDAERRVREAYLETSRSWKTRRRDQPGCGTTNPRP